MQARPTSSVLAAAALALLAAAGILPPSTAAAQVPRDGIERQEMFAERRAEFLRRLDSGVAVFHAKPVYNRNDDIDYPYRQDSDFYYLTGFEEPEAVAVLSAGEEAVDGGQRGGEGAGPVYTLFVRPRNPDPFDREGEIWAGHRWGAEGARETFGADAAYTLDSLAAVMPRLLEGASRVLYSSAGDLEFGERLREWAEASAPPPGGAAGELGPTAGDARAHAPAGAGEEMPGSAGFESPLPIVHEMRLIHSPAEIARIQRAIDITEDALRASMRAAAPGLYEYDLEALQYYIYRTNGAERYAFPSIVGSGPNSVILHYEENDRQMRDGDVMVMDIGAEYAMYAADVTRTIPVSGTFTPEQREVYQIVVDAQDAAMELMRPGHTLADASRRAAEVVTAGLVRLGLLEGTVEENLASGAYRQFYMHGLSHWIGLDVHDPPSYTEPDGSPRAFRPGMILSNEPGIYIREGLPGVDPKWHHVGVRLENDVLVTEGEPIDMTSRIPRTIADVEAEMAKPPLAIETGRVRPPLPAVDGRAGAGPEPGREGAATGGQDRKAVPAPGPITPPDRGKPKYPGRPAPPAETGEGAPR